MLQWPAYQEPSLSPPTNVDEANCQVTIKAQQMTGEIVLVPSRCFASKLVSFDKNGSSLSQLKQVFRCDMAFSTARLAKLCLTIKWGLTLKVC